MGKKGRVQVRQNGGEARFIYSETVARACAYCDPKSVVALPFWDAAFADVAESREAEGCGSCGKQGGRVGLELLEGGDICLALEGRSELAGLAEDGGDTWAWFLWLAVQADLL